MGYISIRDTGVANKGSLTMISTTYEFESGASVLLEHDKEKGTLFLDVEDGAEFLLTAADLHALIFSVWDQGKRLGMDLQSERDEEEIDAAYVEGREESASDYDAGFQDGYDVGLTEGDDGDEDADECGPECSLCSLEDE